MRSGAAIFLAVTVLPAMGQPQLKNGLMAIVNDAVITFQDVERLTITQLEALRATYRFQPEVYEQKRIQVLEEGLEHLIERQLVLDDFKAQGGVLPESVIDDNIKDIIRRGYYGDRAKFIKTLQAQGKTYESLRQERREDLIYDYMRQIKIGAPLIVSPAKIEEYYRTNQHEYKVGEQIKLRMIVLDRRRSGASADELRQLAQELLGKIQAGVSFAEMASIYSEGSTQREAGDWGWIERSKLNKGLSDLAFSLKLDQPSPVASLARDTGDDYWISLYDPEGQITSAKKYTSRDVFVTEKNPAAQPDDAKDLPSAQEFYIMVVEDHRHAHSRPLEEVREQIEKDLLVQEHERMRKKWIERLKAKSFVRYFM